MAIDLREYIRAYNRRRYDYRKENGLCVRCGADAEGRTVCKACALKVGESYRRLYKQRKEAGLCVTCGAEVTDGRVKCAECRERQKKDVAWRKRRQRMLNDKLRWINAAGGCR